jgi:hypothetical protein
MAKEKSKDLTCATCRKCDVRAAGFCQDETVKAALDGWAGVVTFPEQFGCMAWEPATKEKK